MRKAIGMIAATLALTLIASVALAVALPPQANSRAVDATQNTPSGADVSDHPNADVNGVPPAPPVWLNDMAPYGPPEWANTSGGLPTWVTTP